MAVLCRQQQQRKKQQQQQKKRNVEFWLHAAAGKSGQKAQWRRMVQAIRAAIQQQEKENKSQTKK
jgi:hypothetical protein